MQILRIRQRRPTVETPGSLFWPLVERGHPADCWPWRGRLGGTGYGDAAWEGKRIAAHRLAFLVAGGTLIPGMVIMHLCDNPPCCNPAHLRQGTHADNIHDSIAKGRHSSCVSNLVALREYEEEQAGRQ